MKDIFEICRATNVDEKSIAIAWQKGYGPLFPYLYPSRWKWLFEKNPFLTNHRGELPIWIAKQDGKVVSWTCAMEVPMEIKGQRWPGAWGNLALTLKEYRRRGLGKSLQREYPKTYPSFVGIGMSKENRRNVYRAGGKIGKPLFVYLKLLRRFHQDTLYSSMIQAMEKNMGTSWAGVLSNIGKYGPKQAINWTASLLYRAGQKIAEPTFFGYQAALSFQEISEFGDEIDQFWEKIRGRYSFAVPRCSVYLNWKYVQQPHVRFQRYIVRETGGHIDGVIIFGMGDPPSLPIGIICEVLLREEKKDLAKYLLRFAQKKLIDAGADMIYCGASVPFLRQALQEQAFRLIYVDVPAVNLSLEAKAEIDFANVRSGQWLLSLGDSDLDMYHLNDQLDLLYIALVVLNRIPGLEDLARPHLE